MGLLATQMRARRNGQVLFDVLRKIAYDEYLDTMGRAHATYVTNFDESFRARDAQTLSETEYVDLHRQFRLTWNAQVKEAQEALQVTLETFEKEFQTCIR